MSCSNQYKHLTCYLLNVRSLVNKLSQLYYFLYSNQPDMFLVTETWLRPDICSGLLDPCSKYHLIRKDRSEARGGGVCVFVSRKFDIVSVNIDNQFSSLELLCFDLVTSTSRLRVFVVYRPPQYHNTAISYMKLLVDCLDRYVNKSLTNIITGDFNCPGVNWSTLSCPNDNIQNIFVDFVVYSGFSQCVKFATRGRNTLDLVLVDDNN